MFNLDAQEGHDCAENAAHFGPTKTNGPTADSVICREYALRWILRVPVTENGAHHNALWFTIGNMAATFPTMAAKSL